MAGDGEAVARVRDGKSSVVVDSRYWPVVFLTWFGGPTERVLVGFFDENAALIERARRDAKPFVLIVDTVFAGAPNPKVRKVIAKLTNDQPTDAAAQTRSIIVIENALIRGVVTALSWFIPRIRESRIAGSIEQAIDLALRVLDEDGTARPTTLGASEYRRPKDLTG